MTLGEKILKAMKENEHRKKFISDFRSELNQIRQWERDMRYYLELPDSEYKFSQLNNATSAIYSLYVRMSNILSNYKPEGLPKYHK